MAEEREYPFDSYGGEPPHNGTDTSREAARRVRKTVSQKAQTVLQAVTAAGAYGATCDEVEVAIDMSHQTASARMRELALAGLIEDTGLRRPTRTNSPAKVWRRKPQRRRE